MDFRIGDRVTVTEESAMNGFEFDQDIAKDLIGKVLSVSEVFVSDFRTEIAFEEIGGWFNSENFVKVDDFPIDCSMVA